MAKGKVSISVDRGSLRLRWGYNGQRYTLGLGLRADLIGRRLASDRLREDSTVA